MMTLKEFIFNGPINKTSISSIKVIDSDNDKIYTDITKTIIPSNSDEFMNSSTNFLSEMAKVKFCRLYESKTDGKFNIEVIVLLPSVEKFSMLFYAKILIYQN